MKLTRWKNKQTDPLLDLFNWDQPHFGLSFFPTVDHSFAGSNWIPAIDISDDDKNIVVKADLPGLKREDIQVSLDNNILTIRGERKSEETKKEKNYHRVERSYGVFERRLDLGTGIDESSVQANYKNGVLELTLPKSQDSDVKRIEIKEG